MKYFLVLLAVAVLFVLVGCEEATPKSLLIESSGQTGIIVDPSSVKYEEIRTFLEDSEAAMEYGQYQLTATQYGEVRSILGPLPAEEVRKAELWKEQWVHWENVDAFDAAVAEIRKDKVVDLEEGLYICVVALQWADDMREAQEYVAEFTEVDPETVESNPGIGNLQRGAKERAELVETMLAGCDGI